MENSGDHQNTQKVERLWNAASNLAWSVKLHRWVGYGLLALTLLDLIEIFVPPNFTNPLWEFSVFGNLVEQVTVPLLGLVLVFMGKGESRLKWELRILKYLSHLTLVIGLLYLVLIPLGVFNTMRIDKLDNQQITSRADRGIRQVKNVQNQLEAVTTIEQMEALLSRLDRQGRAPDISGTEMFDTVKQQLATFLAEGEDRLNTQAKETRSAQHVKLLKRSVKWNLGALLSGVLFLGIWRGTSWARGNR